MGGGLVTNLAGAGLGGLAGYLGSGALMGEPSGSAKPGKSEEKEEKVGPGFHRGMAPGAVFKAASTPLGRWLQKRAESHCLDAKPYTPGEGKNKPKQQQPAGAVPGGSAPVNSVAQLQKTALAKWLEKRSVKKQDNDKRKRYNRARKIQNLRIGPKGKARFHEETEKVAEPLKSRDFNDPGIGGDLADYILGGSLWGATRAGRSSHMADASKQDPGFNVRHPFTSDLLAALAGQVGGGLLGAGAGGAGGMLLGEPGHGAAIGGLTGMGGGAFAGLLAARYLRNKKMKEIGKKFDEASAKGELTNPDPGMSTLKNILLPFGGAHRGGQADVYESIANNEKHKGQGLLRTLGHASAFTPIYGALSRPFVGMAHGIGAKDRVDRAKNKGGDSALASSPVTGNAGGAGPFSPEQEAKLRELLGYNKAASFSKKAAEPLTGSQPPPLSEPSPFHSGGGRLPTSTPPAAISATATPHPSLSKDRVAQMQQQNNEWANKNWSRHWDVAANKYYPDNSTEPATGTVTGSAAAGPQQPSSTAGTGGYTPGNVAQEAGNQAAQKVLPQSSPLQQYVK
jgi:hypothetical protein